MKGELTDNEAAQYKVHKLDKTTGLENLLSDYAPQSPEHQFAVTPAQPPFGFDDDITQDKIEELLREAATSESSQPPPDLDAADAATNLDALPPPTPDAAANLDALPLVQATLNTPVAAPLSVTTPRSRTPPPSTAPLSLSLKMLSSAKMLEHARAKHLAANKGAAANNQDAEMPPTNEKVHITVEGRTKQELDRVLDLGLKAIYTIN